MLKRGRGVDNRFRFWHQLYRRCKSEDLIGDRLSPASIRYDNQSVNWSKYSKPWDVVFDYPRHGIVHFLVGDLPTELPKHNPSAGKAKLHSFFPAHVPEEENYAHSEIWTYKHESNEQKIRIEKPKLSETVKKEFRQIMSDRGVVILRPEM